MVYVLLVEWDLGDNNFDSGNEIFVFDTIEKAQAEFKAYMEQAKKDMAHLNTDEHNYCEGDMAWGIWETGNYVYNHIDLLIKECEVK